MKATATKLQGVILLEHDIFSDDRGDFYESFNEDRWRKLGLIFHPVQENQSLSLNTGTIRGLHYQLNPKAQSKAVRVVTGAVLDVVLDLRQKSATFGSWISVLLSEENKRSIFIPKGLAHGFCTLTPSTRVVYLTDEFYAPEYDRGILWNDPALGIPWPVEKPVISEKDKSNPRLADAENNF